MAGPDHCSLATEAVKDGRERPLTARKTADPRERPVADTSVSGDPALK